MSEENVLCSHELLIRFDQLEGNRVNWYIEPRPGRIAPASICSAFTRSFGQSPAGKRRAPAAI